MDEHLQEDCLVRVDKVSVDHWRKCEAEPRWLLPVMDEHLQEDCLVRVDKVSVDHWRKCEAEPRWLLLAGWTSTRGLLSQSKVSVDYWWRCEAEPWWLLWMNNRVSWYWNQDHCQAGEGSFCCKSLQNMFKNVFGPLAASSQVYTSRAMQYMSKYSFSPSTAYENLRFLVKV
jgi:hypothetical protein